MVCQPRQERSGTWWREPNIGLGMAGQTSEPNPLSAGIPSLPFPAFPQAKIWLSARNFFYVILFWEGKKTNKQILDINIIIVSNTWTTVVHMLLPSVAAMVNPSPQDTLVTIFPPNGPTRTWTHWCFLKSFTPNCPYLLQPKVIRRPRSAKTKIIWTKPLWHSYFLEEKW